MCPRSALWLEVAMLCCWTVVCESGHEKESGPCTMHTYFDEAALSSDGEESLKGQMATLQAWTRAWEEAGWDTRILDEYSAKNHPDYYTLKANFNSLPTVNPKKYEVSCFMRHVAMASVGGGWMSDYDVVPVNMPRCLALPNNERFTTHESHVPSLVSGSAEEYTRVAHLIGNMPWRDVRYAKEFTVRGRPHVSDMVALQFIASTRDINTGARGCGVVSPDKLLVSGQCQTCKYGGAPYATHFAHAEMDKVLRLYKTDNTPDAPPHVTPKIKLNCTNSVDAYPHWNHWRAACLLEGSRVIRDHCDKQAKEISAAGTVVGAGGEVVHRDESCHAECGGEAGACSEFCGPGGACCRRGFPDAADDPHCGFGTVGCDHRHCCVAISADATAAVASAGKNTEEIAAAAAEATAESKPPPPSPVVSAEASKSQQDTSPAAAPKSLDVAQSGSGHPDTDLCTRGIIGGEGVWPICCGRSCGSCGGLGCQERPGGIDLCCAGRIMRSARKCVYPDQVGCVMPPFNVFAALEYVAPAFEMAEDLSHLGQTCHAECNGEPGLCATGFCGRAGACCRRGFQFDKDELACGFGALGCADKHCCVAASKPKPDQLVLKNEGQSCHHECDGKSGPCIEFCGAGGSCCRLGFEDAADEESCGFGSVGCDGSHCCVASAQ